jgi:FtsP/CotA-like multicopper oxidase with cupredoxin domain
VLRGNAGDRLRIRVVNGLPEPTTVHWHGLAIRNDMDGVPGVTQPPIRPGGEFTYEFVLPEPGTYWYHTHARLQRGRGLYGPLIIDDPREPGGYDAEFIVVLSDWLLHRTTEQVFTALTHGANFGKMPSKPLGGPGGDVRFPVYLLGGRQPSAPVTFRARPGQRARIRLINAADDTTFRVALGGHRITVTGTDGHAASPVTGDAVLVGMGERYDLDVTLGDGVFPLVASAEGKNARAFGIVRTAAGRPPTPGMTVPELNRKVLTVANLTAAQSDVLPPRTPDAMLAGMLSGSMARYTWMINGRAYPHNAPLAVHPGERVRLVYTNPTPMYHPMHLHGHTFAIARPGGAGPRKDTVIVLPGQSVGLDFDTDNPGQWFTHCHNDYHEAAGMATVVSYRT